MSLNWEALFKPESLIALGKTTIPENALTMIAMLVFIKTNSRIITKHPRAQILAVSFSPMVEVLNIRSRR